MKTQKLLSFKKILFINVFFISFFSAKAQLNFGGGLCYGTDIERMGLNLRGGFLINEKLNVGADLNFFFPETDGAAKASFYEINLNGYYWLEASDNILFYPLAGLNISFFSFSFDSPVGNISESDSEIGFNVGGGLGFKINNLTPFVEGKYIISEWDQVVLTFGVLILLDN